MKKGYLYFALFAAASTACNKNEMDPVQSGDEPKVEVKMITETVTGGKGVSKATISNTDASFKWTTGDHIAVHVSNGDSHKYVFTSDAGAAGASTAAASASFTVVYEEGYSRDAFALFPSTIVSETAANYGQSGSALDVTLPSSYTLAQVSDETSPCPMIATNTAGSGWDFYQLCGLLRLTVNGIPNDATGIVIQFPSKKVNGSFSIASPVNPGTSTIETGAPATGEDIITVTFAAGITSATVNIPLPTGDYEDIYITSVGGSKKVEAFRTIKAGGYTATTTRAKKLTVTVSSISVSASKQVVFAPGNLQYLGNANGTGTWRFADHQYDFMGDGPSSDTNYQGNVTVAGYAKYNNSADMDVARDLFGWGTSGYNGKNPYLTSTNSGSYYSGSLTDTDYDWGVYHSASGNSSEKIVNGGNYSWRLFTSEEWAYVIARQGRVYTRQDYKETKDLFAPATVVGVKGIILFPDNWDGSSDRTIKYGNPSNGGYDKTIRDAEQWAVLENMGCVFLPAAHGRDGVTISYYNEGHYWAGTVFSVLNNTEYRGGTLEWTSSGSVTKSSNNDRVRKLGQSVRLIRDL